MRKCLVIVALVTGVVAPHAAQAAEPSLLMPVRAVSYVMTDSQEIGVTGILKPGTYALSAADKRYSDNFRRDAIKVWSVSTRSAWNLLPPKFLGNGSTMQARPANFKDYKLRYTMR